MDLSKKENHSYEWFSFLVSRFPDLNWGPSIYKIVALPTELKRHRGTFEPNFYSSILAYFNQNSSPPC